MYSVYYNTYSVCAIIIIVTCNNQKYLFDLFTSMTNIRTSVQVLH